MKIGWVAPVKPSHPYLENDPAPLFDLHYLRISPWIWFSTTAALLTPVAIADVGNVIAGLRLVPSFRRPPESRKPPGHAASPEARPYRFRPPPSWK